MKLWDWLRNWHSCWANMVDLKRTAGGYEPAHPFPRGPFDPNPPTSAVWHQRCAVCGKSGIRMYYGGVSPFSSGPSSNHCNGDS